MTNYPDGYFGPHLLYDGFGCRADALTSVDSLFTLLDALPGKIGMTKITQPHCFRYSGAVPEDWGVTGVVVLAESHCSAHTFPTRDGFVTVDLYSCKNFDTEAVVAILDEHFTPTRRQYQVIRRGAGFSRSPQ